MNRDYQAIFQDIYLLKTIYVLNDLTTVYSWYISPTLHTDALALRKKGFRKLLAII